MRGRFIHKYHDIISLDNLFAAWQEFVVGKLSKPDVRKFGFRLVDNVIDLHEALINGSYKHKSYFNFAITDPKPRQIHKATVRDRVLHHAIYRQLYPLFNNTFIADSYSCRNNKGTHKAMERFQRFAYKVSQNHTRTAWVLKCDIKKFFATIDHKVLLKILKTYISDRDTIKLLEKIIKSFPGPNGKGLPLGNLTSQLFCNIYMNEFDQFVKHKLRVKYYVRYADDFVFLSHKRNYLEALTPWISIFLEKRLKLSLHPDKVFIQSFASGVDFLGWVHYPTHRVLRGVTRRRVFRRIKEHPTNETLQSYLGLLNHGNTHVIEEQIINSYGLLAK